MKTAVIIGNGITREDFNLEEIKTLGTTYGCNALYRNFFPDYLIAIDPKMIEEIKKSDFPQEKIIIPPLEEQFEPAEFNPNRPRSNAGMNAMEEAIKHGHNNLICIGFDFMTETFCMSNIYENTACYEHGASYQDTLNRVEYFEYFAKKHKDIIFNFMFITDRKDIKMRKFKEDLSNVKGVFLHGNN